MIFKQAIKSKEYGRNRRIFNNGGSSISSSVSNNGGGSSWLDQYFSYSNSILNLNNAFKVDGNLEIIGDIIQNGAAYETHAEHVFSKNDFITLRDGAVSGLGSGYAGFLAKLYDGANDGQLVFGSDGFARVGDVGDLQILATRQTSPIANGIAFWNDVNKRFDTKAENTLSVAFAQAALNAQFAENADKLDNLHASQFVRSDANDSVSGALTFTNRATFSRSTTIGGSDLANAYALFGTTSNGIGIDNNEIQSKGGNLNIGTVDSYAINFKTEGGNLKMQIASDGNVRITKTLDFGYNWNSKTKGVNFSDGANNALSFYDGVGASARIYREGDNFYVGARGGVITQGLNILGNGNVGIGKTPTEALDINGAIVQSVSKSNGWAAIFNNTSSSVGAGVQINTTVTDGTSALNIISGSSQIFRVQSNGLVKIGTGNATEALDVEGNIAISGTGTIGGNMQALTFRNSAVNTSYNWFARDSSTSFPVIVQNPNVADTAPLIGGYVGSTSVAQGTRVFAIAKNYAEFNTNVKIGIGTPTEALDVSGNGYFSGNNANIKIEDSSSRKPYIELNRGGGSWGTSGYRAWRMLNDGGVLKLQSANHEGVTDSSLVLTSSMVGINTSPNESLSILSDSFNTIRLSRNNSANGTGILFSNTSGDQGRFGLDAVSDAYIFQNASMSTVARIKRSNGWLSVASTEEGTQALDVNGNIIATGGNRFIQNTVGFSTGYAGNGSRWWEDNNGTNLEVDNLRVRKRMDIYELVLNKIRATNGSLWVSDAMQIEIINQSGPHIYTAENELCPFVVDDIIGVQTWDMVNTQLVYFEARVTNVAQSGTYPTRQFATLSVLNGDIYDLKAGDTIVRVDYDGTEYPERKGVLYLTSSDSGSPYMDVVHSGVSALRVGRLDGYDNDKSGYGIAANGGKFHISTDGTAKIAGWNFNNEAIYTTYNGTTLSLGIAQNWTSSVYGLQVGVDTGNRIWLGTLNNTFDLNCNVGGTSIFRLGGISNEIAGWEFNRYRLTSSDGKLFLDTANKTIGVAYQDYAALDEGSVYMNYVDSQNWGLYGRNSVGSFVFKLGAVNEIAGWTFSSSTFSKQISSSTFLEMGSILGDGSAGYLIRGNNSSNQISMYVKSTSDWGIKGVVSSSEFFRLGSSNHIANWEFDNRSLWNVYNTYRHIILSNSETETSTRGKRGFTIFNDDTYIGDYGFKLARFGMISKQHTAQDWTNGVEYGVQIGYMFSGDGYKDVFRVDQNGAKIGGFDVGFNKLEGGFVRIQTDSGDTSLNSQGYFDLIQSQALSENSALRFFERYENGNETLRAKISGGVDPNNRWDHLTLHEGTVGGGNYIQLINGFYSSGQVRVNAVGDSGKVIIYINEVARFEISKHQTYNTTKIKILNCPTSTTGLVSGEIYRDINTNNVKIVP